MALLHCAAMTATAAEYVGGGCCCALQFKLDMVEWVNCWFLISFLMVVSPDFLAVEFKLVVVGASGNQKI
jgi:hypothetical protein